MKKTLQAAFLGFMALGLVACASTDDETPGGAGAGADGQGAYSESSDVQGQGVNGQDGFYGKDKQFTERQLMDQNVVYFGFDSNVVEADQIAIIEAHGEYLAQHPNTKVLLEGNTDIRGSREYNVALGYRRDQAVEQILTAAGVVPGQISSVSYGAEKPAVLGDTEDAYSKNRRVVIVYENKA